MTSAPGPRILTNIARFALHRLGGLRPLIWSSRNRFRILTYHRFSPAVFPKGPEILERQCAFLRRRFHPVPLAEIARSLETGAPLPPKALAVTVDDGYRDFFLDGFPIFRRWQIPVTVYLVTDFLDGKLWPWWNQVDYAARHGRAARVSLSLFADRAGQELPLGTGDERERAAVVIGGQLVKAPHRVRLAFLEALPALFDVEIPPQPPPEHAALTWDEVRQLAAAGVEFGSHTRTHPILPNMEDRSLAEEEIAGSKARIEQELERPVIHFCYPNGDYDDATVAAVARCGFQTAVTIRRGCNAPREDRYLLKRLSVDPGGSDEYFRESVAGLHN